jgi:hypothetical protein
MVEQEPGQPGAVGAGAFDADRAEPPVATSPPQQLAVAVGVGAELGVGQQPALLVDDGGVVGAAVVSTPPVTTRVRLAILSLPFLPRTRARAGRAGGQASDGLGQASSYQVTPSVRSRAPP